MVINARRRASAELGPLHRSFQVANGPCRPDRRQRAHTARCRWGDVAEPENGFRVAAQRVRVEVVDDAPLPPRVAITARTPGSPNAALMSRTRSSSRPARYPHRSKKCSPNSTRRPHDDSTSTPRITPSRSGGLAVTPAPDPRAATAATATPAGRQCCPRRGCPRRDPPPTSAHQSVRPVGQRGWPIAVCVVPVGLGRQSAGVTGRVHDPGFY